jgi:hypothetical protein
LASVALQVMDEEEISDVRLTTFRVFKAQSISAGRTRTRVSQGACGTGLYTLARELGADVQHPGERLPTYYGLWIGNLVRGELAAARTTGKFILTRRRDRGIAGRSRGSAARPRPDVPLAG